MKDKDIIRNNLKNYHRVEITEVKDDDNQGVDSITKDWYATANILYRLILLRNKYVYIDEQINENPLVNALG